MSERLLELELSANEPRNPAWLSKESGCPRSMLSELLNGVRHTTTYLEEIHRALGWDPPLGPLLSDDDQELLGIARRLTPEQRARLHERALVLSEEKRKSK